VSGMVPTLAEPVTRNDISWRSRAICASVDPEIFFGLPKDYATHEKAKSICANCPVRTECVIDALDTGALHGIRGGLDEAQLTELYRRRKAAA
jgi:WhiB family transcriptional regulator, redox-sensing transcriptional regulator